MHLGAYFDSLYGADDDPYGLRDRWYERRKRAVLLASLPRPRYRSVYEPGCGVAELTAELALRCDRLLASDFCERAVAVARTRVAPLTQVKVERHRLPHDWPHEAGPFDLIVLSELGYFFEAGAWAELARACESSLSSDGELVACDWKPDFDRRRLATQQVQSALSALGLHRMLCHDEEDFVLQVWSRDPRSVATREAIG